MKFLINSDSKSAGARVCVHDLSIMLQKNGHEVTRNDWDYKGNYEVILFMSDRSEVKKARRKNPKALIGIMDPKIAFKNKEENKAADFLVVSSIEQQDALFSLNKNIVICYMFPITPIVHKTHINKDKILIAYHGNKLHLHAFYPVISNALDKLSEKYNLELWAIYNIKSLGKWTKGKPKKIKVQHIQWDENTVADYLQQCDIGIVNNLKPVYRPWPKIRISNIIMNFISRGYGKDYSDLIFRYKYNTNPGRIYVFSRLFVPIVSDYALSSSQFIQQNVSGILANSEDGWIQALESIIISAEKRNRLSQNLYQYINENSSIEINFNALMQYISNQINIKKNDYTD